jgi:hypothetical protein
MPRPRIRKPGPLGKVIDDWRETRSDVSDLAACFALIARQLRAERLSVGPKAVETWYYGVHHPNPANYAALAKFLGYSGVEALDAVCEKSGRPEHEARTTPAPEGFQPPAKRPPAIQNNDAELIVRSDSLLKAVEETLRKSILDVPYFKLYHNVHYSYQWDPEGFIRIHDKSKYAVQNRLDQPIDYDLFVGIWKVRGRLLDDKSAITRLACHCPNLMDDPSLNFEYSQPTEIDPYEDPTRRDKNIRRRIKLPPRERIEVETEGILCTYPIDNDPILHFAPTGKFTLTVDVSGCPGLTIRAAPLHP